MAARKPSRKRKPTTDPIDAFVNIIARPEVVGLILVLISVLTLLSLLTSSTGAITSAWLAWLTQLFGIAVWGFPIVTGVLGLWMVIRAVEKMPNMPWQQPVALGILFLAGLIGTTLWMGTEGAGGGVIGTLLANALRQVLGVGVAWAFVTFLMISGLLLLTDRLFFDLGYHLWLSAQELWYGWEDQRHTTALNPPVPLPSGKLPWHRELLHHWQNRWSQPAQSAYATPATENLVRANPLRAIEQPAREQRRTGGINTGGGKQGSR